jgi:hypothetical protein
VARERIVARSPGSEKLRASSPSGVLTWK